MANRDGSNDKKVLWARVPATINSDTTSAGNVIDTQGYDKVTFVLIAGSYTDGTYTPLISESDASNMAGENAVADDELTRLESAAAVSAATSNSADNSKKIGYLGSKRYVTCDIVSTGTSSGASVGVLAILENASIQPVA